MMKSVEEKLPEIIAKLEAKNGGETPYTRHLKKQLADSLARPADPATAKKKEVTYFSGNGPSQPETKKPEGE